MLCHCVLILTGHSSKAHPPTKHLFKFWETSITMPQINFEMTEIIVFFYIYIYTLIILSCETGFCNSPLSSLIANSIAKKFL